MVLAKKQWWWTAFWALGLAAAVNGGDDDDDDPLQRWQVENVTVPLYGGFDSLGYVYTKVRPEENEPVMDDKGLVVPRGYEFRMIVDSGSKLTYLPCTGCTVKSCGPRRVEKVLNRKHESLESRCSDLMCPEPSRTCHQTDFGTPDICYMDETFPGSSYLKGQYVTARLNISTYQRWLTIGCANEIGGSLRDQLADGSLGFGYGSWLLQISANGWSICLAKAGYAGGTLTIGKKVKFPTRATWIKVVPPELNRFWDGAYRVQLTNGSPFRIGQTDCKSKTRVFASINTGSPFSWLPSDLFKEARSIFFSECTSPTQTEEGSKSCGGNVRVTGDSQALACYNLEGSSLGTSKPGIFSSRSIEDVLQVHAYLNEQFPNIVFRIPSDSDRSKALLENVEIHPKEYLYQPKPNEATFCIGFFEVSNKDTSAVVFGLNILRGLEMQFDNSKQAMIFKTCDKEFEPEVVSDGNSQDDYKDDDGAKEGDDDHGHGDGISDNSTRAKAGLVAFLLSFLLTLLSLCCFKRFCGSAEVKYQALDDSAGTLRGLPAFPDRDLEMPNQFSTSTDEIALVDVPSVGYSHAIQSDSDHSDDEDHDHDLIAESSSDGRSKHAKVSSNK